MIKILFVCHGNICRSPMAEMVFKDMLRKKGLDHKVQVGSMATSTEEIGSDVHPGTKAILSREGIACEKRKAVQITRCDYENSNYIICMDKANIRNLERLIGKDTDAKVSLLLDYTDSPGEIADPWYTGDFNATYNDVLKGCAGLLKHIL